MIRVLAIAVSLLAGCSKTHSISDSDGPPASCRASGSCTTGPACGTKCCAANEQCVSGTCMCGTHPSCTDGNTCQIALPMPEQTCGTICCGATQICPR